jgi:hypothetical protein
MPMTRALAMEISADTSETSDVADTSDVSGPREERLGFISPGGDGLVRLGSVSIETGDTQWIDMPGYFGISEAVWSGNGKRVAFTPYDADWRNDYADMQIMVMNADGTELIEGPTGRFPALDYSGDVLAWVDFDSTLSGEPPISVIRGRVFAFDYSTTTNIDFAEEPGLIVSGPSTFVIPRALWVHKSDAGVHAYAQVEISTARSGDVPGTLNYSLYSLADGSTKTIASTAAGISGFSPIGVNFEGSFFYAVRVNSDSQTSEIRWGSNVSYGHTEAGLQIFSPNANRSIQSFQGRWYFGTPLYEEQTLITFGLPTKPCTWFENY